MRALIVFPLKNTELLHYQETIYALRQLCPDDEIVTVAPAEGPSLGILEANPCIDRVYPLPGRTPLNELPPNEAIAFLADKQIDKAYVAFRGAGSGSNLRMVRDAWGYPGTVYLWRVRKKPIPLRSPQGMLRAFVNGINLSKMAFEDLFRAAAERFVAKPLRPNNGGPDQEPLRPNNGGLDDFHPRRILCMPMDGLGDLVIMMPALRALQRRYPSAQVDVVLREAYLPLYRDLMPNVGLLPFELPKTPARGRPPAGTREVLMLLGTLRRNRYDLAIDFGGLDLYRQLAFWAGIAVRVGAARSNGEDRGRRNWSGLLTCPVHYRHSDSHTHDLAFEVLSTVGVDKTADSTRDLLVTDEGTARVRGLVDERGVGGRFALVQAFSVIDAKHWREDGFAEAIDHMVEKYDLDILLTGSPGDRAGNDRLRGMSRHQGRVHNVAGDVSLSDFGCLCAQASMMLTLDTGPMHFAAAVGTPVVALFLPGTLDLFYPYGQRKRAICPSADELRVAFGEKQGRYVDVLGTIATSRVLAGIDRALGKSGVEAVHEAAHR